MPRRHWHGSVTTWPLPAARPWAPLTTTRAMATVLTIPAATASGRRGAGTRPAAKGHQQSMQAYIWQSLATLTQTFICVGPLENTISPGKVRFEKEKVSGHNAFLWGPNTNILKVPRNPITGDMSNFHKSNMADIYCYLAIYFLLVDLFEWLKTLE